VQPLYASVELRVDDVSEVQPDAVALG